MGPRRVRGAALPATVSMEMRVPSEVPAADVTEQKTAVYTKKGRGTKPVEAATMPEAEKENLVNDVPVAAKKGTRTGKVPKALSVEAPQATVAEVAPHAEEPAPEAPAADSPPPEAVKATKRASKKKEVPLQGCLDKEVAAVTQTMERMDLDKKAAELHEQEARLQAIQAKLDQQAAALQLKSEAQEKREVKLKKLQKAQARASPPEVEESKSKRKTKDPEAPKKALTAFFVYSAERRPILRAERNLSFTETGKALGDEWKNLSDEAKSPYIMIAAEDKLRYASELEAYKLKRGDADVPGSDDEEGDESESSPSLRKKGAKDGVSMKAKVKVQVKDPNKPKRAPSAYNLFTKDKQLEVRTANPGAKLGEITTIVSKLWQELGDDGKKVWAEKALAGQERYKEEMIQYKGKQ